MDKSLRVYIVTEGSKNTGFGHIARCTSIYQAFEEKGITPELIVNGDETIKDFLKGKKFRITNWLEDKEQLFGTVEEADIVVIDSYLARYDFYKKISVSVRSPTYFDDDKRVDYPRGIVLNGAIFAEEAGYPEKEDVTNLLGSKYIPLRKEFWTIPEKKINKNLKNIMITFGGDDGGNMTPKVLRCLVDNYPELSKYVVIGRGFKNIIEINRVKDDKTDLISHPDADGMKKVMLESDIAISAGGQTLYELARVGVPTIATAVADNQLCSIKGWQKKGFIEYAGWWKDEDVLNNIVEKISLLKNYSVRVEKAKAGRLKVDGVGANRIVRYLIRSHFEKALVLRKAEKKDMQDVYELTNESAVRKNSFEQSKIEWGNHKNWFINKIKEKNYLFLIVEIDNSFIGQIRFDINGNQHEAVISISIGRNYRGFDIGKLIVQKGLNFLKLINPAIKNVKALIKDEHTSSVKLFKKSDFKFVKKLTIKDQNAVEYSYQFSKG